MKPKTTELRVLLASLGLPDSYDDAFDAITAKVLDLETDSQRLDFLEAYCDGVTFERTSNLLEPTVVLDFFAGDGGGHTLARGTNWREAIDKAKEPA